MSALYAMRYLGGAGVGLGAVYVGKGIIVGVDVGDGRYNGTYTEEGGRLQAKLTLSMPNGGLLVTGDQVTPGTEIPLTADWDSDFDSGQVQQIMVAGRPVEVTFEKIGDVP